MTDNERKKLERETKAHLIDLIEKLQDEIENWTQMSRGFDTYYKRQADWWEDHYRLLCDGISIVHPSDVKWMEEHDPGHPHMDIYNRLLYGFAHREDGAYIRRSSWMHVGTPQCASCPLTKWYEEERNTNHDA